MAGQVVRLGAAKGLTDASLSPERRLHAYWLLIQRAWLASGRSLPAPRPRSELPGEVFEISNDG
jgi:hypothetical protein